VLDDLFNEAPKAAPEEAPAAPAVEDDPFSSNGQLPNRSWVDNTGRYTISGRLVKVLDGKVRLLKDNGKFSTVEMRRLSAGDRQYVEQLVAKFGNDLTTKIAAR
jgi:hypothetical protein